MCPNAPSKLGPKIESQISIPHVIEVNAIFCVSDIQFLESFHNVCQASSFPYLSLCICKHTRIQTLTINIDKPRPALLRQFLDGFGILFEQLVVLGWIGQAGPDRAQILVPDRREEDEANST